MPSKSNYIVRQICPPVLWNGMKLLARPFIKSKFASKNAFRKQACEQDLDVYWDSEMAQILETWGVDTVWKEIQLLMVNCNGMVLDVACGTGKTMEIISKFPLDIHGCDISDLLIGKAVNRGIARDHLTVCDATKMPYEDNFFDYAYSIGSLEHFTEDGIYQFILECQRVTRRASYHMVPVSRSGINEGWLKTYQSFHNNSVDWWMEKYHSVYQTVYVLESAWDDKISVGKWFVCI
ncbi:MAG: class I SAM-dependent methyltransferase [Desulfosalsimonadaceae bacterium]